MRLAGGQVARHAPQKKNVRHFTGAVSKASTAAVAIACTRDVAAYARAAAKAAARATRDVAAALSGIGARAQGLSLGVGCLCCVLALGCASSVIPEEDDWLTDRG